MHTLTVIQATVTDASFAGGSSRCPVMDKALDRAFRLYKLRTSKQILRHSPAAVDSFSRSVPSMLGCMATDASFVHIKCSSASRAIRVVQ